MPHHHQRETRIAQILSVVFHPLFMPTWAYAVLVGFGDPVQHEQDTLWVFIYALYIFGITFVFPAVIFRLMLEMRMISALHMPLRNERHVPILVTAIFFYLLFQLSANWEIDPIFRLYMLGATMLSLVAMLINYWWKISLHTLGVGALFGGVTTLSLYFSPAYFQVLPAVVVVAGATGYARLSLRAHAQSEVYAGLFVGFTLIFMLFALMMG